jgi:hypothetical protein
MFRHQGAILGGLLKRDYEYNMYLGASGTYSLYVYDSELEAHVNMWRFVTDGLDREIVVTIQRVLNLVEMFLRAGEFIRKQEVLKVRLVSPGSW